MRVSAQSSEGIDRNAQCMSVMIPVGAVTILIFITGSIIVQLEHVLILIMRIFMVLFMKI